MYALSNVIARRYSTDMQLLERYERKDIGWSEDIGYRLKHLALALKVEIAAAPRTLTICISSVYLFTDFDRAIWNWTLRPFGGVCALLTITDLLTGRLPDKLVPWEARRHFLGALAPQKMLRNGARFDTERVNEQVRAIAKIILGSLLATAVASSLIIWAEVGVVWAITASLLAGLPYLYLGLHEIHEVGLPGSLNTRLGTLEVTQEYQLTLGSACRVIELALLIFGIYRRAAG